MKVLVLGGCGYTGSELVKFLLKKDIKVEVIDTQWFGRNLIKHKNLKVTKMKISEIEKYKFRNVTSIIHLANIANDPGVELNPNLSWEVNVLDSYKIVNKAIKENVKQIIYASSGSVYGIKKEKKVTEDLSNEPISTYNKTKMIAERVFLSYSNKIKIHCIRPATVCGYSSRIRLDVSVNNLTYQALKNREILVFGGKQIRPNIHINDLINVYYFFLSKRDRIRSDVFNAGFENISILKLAKMIKSKIPSKIKIQKSNDPRSYRQSSEKLLKLGYKPKYKVDDAIDDIISKYKEGKIIASKNHYNVIKMKKLKLNK